MQSRTVLHCVKPCIYLHCLKNLLYYDRQMCAKNVGQETASHDMLFSAAKEINLFIIFSLQGGSSYGVGKNNWNGDRLY